MPVMTRGDVEIYYEVHGEGYPLLALAPGGMRSRVERWHGNPARPDAPLIFKDPTTWLASQYQVIVMDQRNAGRSRAPVTIADGWQSYAQDQLALLDHLGVERCHVLGACIGVSFALRLCEDAPGRISAAVLQNPIGLVAHNRPAVDKLFADWVADQDGRDHIDHSAVPGFGQRMFGGDFIFSVPREAVGRCAVPLMLLPGEDDTHPAGISREIAELAPRIEVVAPWKGPALLEATADRVETFFHRHSPGQPR